MLKHTLVLSLRSLLRHRGRTLMALMAITFGVIALLLASGFIEWVLWAMRESTIESRLGHIQVMTRSYQDEGIANPFGYLLPESSQSKTAIEDMPGVKAVAPRLGFSGLISHGDVTVSFLGEGVDPKQEEQLSKFLIMLKGRNLFAGDPNGLILGQGLAETLGVSPGDTIVLLGNTSLGGFNAIEEEVRGVFYTSNKEFDDAALRLPIATAQRFLRVSGAQVWAVLLDQTEHTDVVLQHMRATLSQGAVPLVFVPWYELADFYNKTVTLFSRQVNVVRFIIALIIMLSITNTLMMSVLERSGEIGTLMALGYRRRKIMELFISEGFLLGLIGGVLGVAAGMILAQGISAVGIPMPPPPGMNVGFTGKIMVTWYIAFVAVVLAAATALVASVYPAWKASRMVIVDALRFNR